MDGSGVPGPRRRPTDGGYARGVETRDRIVEAAYAVFAEEGYVGASTRRIAAAAGVNPPALQYYFDSKEGLHRACGQAVVDRVMLEVGPELDKARAALAGTDRAPMVDALCGLVARLAAFAMVAIETDNWRLFLNRCQADDIGPAFELIERDISGTVKATCIELVARILDRRTDDPETRLRALLIMSQVAAFHTMPERVLANIHWPDFEGGRAELVQKVLCDNVRRMVGAA